MIVMIAAIGKNRELGKDNHLLWHLPNDLKRFKKVTKGHSVIMGRKTYESLGGALPKRQNIVITTNPEYKAENCVVVNSLQEALQYTKNEQKVFILGGAQIYRQAIHLADMLDITHVDASLEADVFFPEIDTNTWQETARENHSSDEQHRYAFSFVSYKRKKQA